MMKRLVVGTLGIAIASLSLAAQGAQTARVVAPAARPAIKAVTPRPAVSHPQAPSAPSAPSARPAPSGTLDAEAQTALVKQYCATCHSERGKAGGLSLASFDAAKAVDHAVIS